MAGSKKSDYFYGFMSGVLEVQTCAGLCRHLGQGLRQCRHCHGPRRAIGLLLGLVLPGLRPSVLTDVFNVSDCAWALGLRFLSFLWA